MADASSIATLDAKLTATLTKCCKGDMGRQIMTEKEKAISAGTLLRGREILHMIYEHSAISEMEGALYDTEDLMAVAMRSNDAREFLTNRDSVLAGMRSRPGEEVLEIWFLKQVRSFPGLQHDLAEYDRQPVGSERHAYAYLYSALSRYIDRERRSNTRSQLTRALGKGACLQALPAGKMPGRKGLQLRPPTGVPIPQRRVVPKRGFVQVRPHQK